MALKIGRAAKLTTDDNGYAIGKLKSVEIKEQVDAKGKLVEQIEWVFQIPTTKGKDADKYLWTGLNVNSQRTYNPINPTTGEVDYNNPQFNKLTQLLLSIGIIDEKQVLNDADIDLDVESFVGKQFRFKVVPDQERPALGDIDIRSIRFAELAE